MKKLTRTGWSDIQRELLGFLRLETRNDSKTNYLYDIEILKLN
jgi:hypothetical protein